MLVGSAYRVSAGMLQQHWPSTCHIDHESKNEMAGGWQGSCWPVSCGLAISLNLFSIIKFRLHVTQASNFFCQDLLCHALCSVLQRGSHSLDNMTVSIHMQLHHHECRTGMYLVAAYRTWSAMSAASRGCMPS